MVKKKGKSQAEKEIEEFGIRSRTWSNNGKSIKQIVKESDDLAKRLRNQMDVNSAK